MELTNPRLFFWLRNGRGLRSVEELMQYLPEVSEEGFRFHVNEHKNDYAKWIHDVFQDELLADFIRDARSPNEMLNLLINYRENNRETEDQTVDATIPEVQEQEAKKPEYELLTSIPEPEPFNEPSAEELFPSAENLDPDKTAEYNDSLVDKFDAAAKRLTEASKHVMPESTEKRIEVLEEREKELHQLISTKRKEGYDLFMAEIILKQFQSRLSLARATEDELDFKLVEETLAEVEKEIHDATSNPLPNVKKEVEELAAS